MKSIRKRFLVIMIGGIGPLFLLFALLLYWIMIHAVNHSLNDNLLALAQRIALQISLDNGQVDIDEAEYQGNFPGVPINHEEQRLQLYLQVWDYRGNTVYKSSSLKNIQLPYLVHPREPVRFRSVKISEEPHLAAVWISFLPVQKDQNPAGSQTLSVRLASPKRQGSLTLAAAIPRGAADEILRILAVWFICISAVMFVFFVILSRYFVKWTMKPVTDIGEEIGNISDRELNKRMDETQIPIEVKPFVNKINTMLSRLEYMFQKEKQFTSDVSHELRTPLAAIRCGLDVAQLTSCNEPSHQSQLTETIKSVEDLQKLIEDLLTLCRADADTYQISSERVDMGEIITESVVQIMPIAKSHGITMEWNPPEEEYPVPGDYHWLNRLCLNLLSNAIYYNKPDGTVHIEIQKDDNQITFSIQDTGIGIPQDGIGKIFERFYRADPSRDSSKGGSGLGLSIAHWIVQAHHGHISVDSKIQVGTLVKVAFPHFTEE